MKNWDVFSIFVFVRLISVLVVQTWFVPDEYWQSLEVAHSLAFGYGHLTWEWALGLRSYIHPLIFTVVFKTLELFNLDYPELLIYIPRILQALLSAYSDLCFYKWSGTRKWAIFTIASSWFWFYMGSRTLINSFETALTVIALSKFPWIGNKEGKLGFLCIVALMCVIRPTAVIQWLPLCIFQICTYKGKVANLLTTRYFLIGISMLLLSTLADSLAHGNFVITSYQFLKANVFQGIGEFYGSHPWHWYLSSGLPAILGIQIIPFVIASIHILRYRYMHPNELAQLGCVVFTIFVYSLLPHKEFRFILPILPICLKISSNFLSQWSCKANKLFIWTVATFLLIGNLVPAWYLGVVHQRGPLDVMPVLRNIIAEKGTNSTFLFLMPCHSTPLYSHLHSNVSARFLTCEPNFENLPHYIDEADQFYVNPDKWLRQHYPPNGTLPSYLISFDKLLPSISSLLSRYKPIARVFHSSITTDQRIGKYIIVHERIDVK